MKFNIKKISKISLAALCLSTTLVAGEVEETNVNDGLFIGATVGTGTGTFSYETDYASYTYPEDGITTTNTKLLIGANKTYLFVQSGTIDYDAYFSNFDYTSYGLGYIYKSENSKLDLGVVTVAPELSVEVGYTALDAEVTDAFGFLLSADIGANVATKVFPGLEFMAAVGYDLHLLKEDAYDEGTWNYRALEVSFGARFYF